jgi:hypothetical protein
LFFNAAVTVSINPSAISPCTRYWVIDTLDDNTPINLNSWEVDEKLKRQALSLSFIRIAGKFFSCSNTFGNDRNMF